MTRYPLLVHALSQNTEDNEHGNAFADGRQNGEYHEEYERTYVNATLMLVTVSVALKAVLISCSTGITIALPMGAAMAQKATMKVRNHFVCRA
ncbi:hypothetical protein ACET3X_008992 [Alternaria dauci]|uniref:Uncharacterized protein n=1 Tax=Alternaria dauci TaxID=48095 RepID=A0ABR3U917_9PLEO